MTIDSDPVERAIDEAARRMTAQAAPDLRARVAARLEHPTPRVAWWLPALAAAAAAWIVLALWPAAPPMDPPRAGGVDISLTAPSREPGAAAPPRETSVHAPAVQTSAVEDSRMEWPEMEPTIEPLALAALTLDPIEPLAEPLAPIEIAPLAVPPLALDPLEERDLQRRR